MFLYSFIKNTKNIAKLVKDLKENKNQPIGCRSSIGPKNKMSFRHASLDLKTNLKLKVPYIQLKLGF